METTMTGVSPTALADKAVTGIDRMRSGTQDAVGRAADATASAVQRLGESGEKLAATGDRWLTAMRSYVVDNPITTVGVAVGIAIGAGLLLGRRTRHME